MSEVVKKQKRGVAAVAATTRRAFTEKEATPSGLFLGHLESVTVDEVTVGADKTGMPSFNGKEIPRLRLTFASNEKKVEDRCYATLTFMPAESTPASLPGREDAWKVEQPLSYMHHILKVFYLNGREFTEKEAEALVLDYDDTDDNGEYVPIDANVVIQAWRNVFYNFATMMNGDTDNKECYRTASGEFIPIYFKLITGYKTKQGVWKPIANNALTFPNYTGDGVFEKYVQNKPPKLRINPAKETIRIINTDKAVKAPTNIAIPGMGVPFGGGVGIGSGDFNTAITDINELAGGNDAMPF